MRDTEENQAGHEERHFLRAVLASKTRVQVGEPVRVALKLKRSAPGRLLTRIGGALGRQRYVTFAEPGIHSVKASVSHRDGRADHAAVDIEVVDAGRDHPYPLLRFSQEPTHPFLLHFGLKNAQQVHRAGVVYEWEIKEYGSFTIYEPYFLVDCERLLNTTDVDIAFDVRFTAVYPDGERRGTAESFRVWNDYAWFKTRGILKPRVEYEYRARPAGKTLAASCLVINDEDELLEITSRQFEVLYDDHDRLMVPQPAEPFRVMVEPKSRRPIDCGIARRDLPQDAVGYAYHFHGQTRSGLKIEISVYFEHYTYTTRWANIATPAAVELLEAVRSAAARSSCRALPEGTVRLSVTGVRNYVEAMMPVWTASEQRKFAGAFDSIVAGSKLGVDHKLMSGESDDFFLGKQCLQDEEPPSDNLVCQLKGQRGKVYVPARIMNGKKGDVVVVPGGPLGFIGGLLQQVEPAQMFSHCGMMIANFYKIRHATASGDWLEDEVYGRTFLDPDAVGTEGFSPESVKYIWPGTITQTVDEAFLGSFFAYKSADGKREKAYRIQAFSRDPVFFENDDRHVIFPMVVKPDPLLEGDPAFALVRPTLIQVAEKAKQISGHYRFFCYSNGAISFRDDTQHRAPERGAAWWASGTRPMVCSTFVLAAVEDLSSDDRSTQRVRVEGRGAFVTEADLEKSRPPDEPPDRFAAVDSLTRDGLYVYDEEERKKAGDWLYDRVYQTAYAKSGSLGRLFTDAPDDFANQVVNTFAFDYSGREFDDEDAKDSDKWKDPGVGRTVSPDDILRFWDRPTAASAELVHGLYGTAQRIVYRESLFEEREIGKWVKRERIGKLIVEVKYQGRVIPGADVKAGGQVKVTSPQGVATIELPEGGYEVEAAVFMNDNFFEGKLTAQVKDRTDTRVTIELNDPPEFFRVVVVGGHVRIKDEENFGEDEFVDETMSLRPVYVGPTHKQDSAPWTRKMGGEIRVEAQFDFFWKPDLSVDVAYNVKLFEGTSEDTGDLDGQRGGVVTLLKDQANVPLNIFVRNDDEDDDDYVDLKLLLSNLVDLQ
jgi:hypothetical protein